MPQQTDTPAAPAIDMTAFVQALKEATGNEAKQISLAAYRAKTPFNPTGDRTRPKLTRRTFQNGARLREHFLTNEEIDLLNKIKAGEYGSTVRVRVIETNDDGANPTVEIQYRNKTTDDRMAFKGEFHTFGDLLRAIVKQQKTA
jgi:hypothetical protein